MRTPMRALAGGPSGARPSRPARASRYPRRPSSSTARLNTASSTRQPIQLSPRGGCPENEAAAPVTAARAAGAVGLRPTDDLDLFGPGGRIDHPDRLRALLDAVVTQELGPSACPQPPRGESWIGCRVDDAVFNRAVELLGRRG